MNAPKRRLHLSAGINSTGAVGSSWRWPGTQWNRFNHFDHYLRSATLAQQGLFDLVFLSDQAALQRDNTTRPIHTFDPIVLFTAIAARVPDIGFLLTASTTYNSPYNLARRLGTLDTISQGRVVWNAVSSFSADVAANYGSESLPQREDRYRRADEFLDVVKKLWLSWDTPTGEQPTGPLWDEKTARTIDHDGEFYSVRGPLNVPIGPQGHPVIAQAGGSDAGIKFAAKHADIVYASLLNKPSAASYKEQLRQSALSNGRDPHNVLLFPALIVVLGDTREEALAKHEALHGSKGDEGLIRDFVSRTELFDSKDQWDPDDVLKPEQFSVEENQNRPVGFNRAVADLVATDEVTLRKLVRIIDGGHRVAIGTPEDVAETILDWWGSGVVDGFNIHFPVLPDGIDEFNRKVVPILQAAGAYPDAYDASTVRGRLRLPAP